jgi:predicted  nucleic acid-binding Zn-ribbon protein
MYTCERCGTKFGRTSVVLESCPRCLARDGVRVPMAFKLRDRPELRPTSRQSTSRLEAAVREQLASGAR